MSSDLYDSAIGKPEKQQYQSQQAPWATQQEPLFQLFHNAGRLYNQGSFNYAASPYTQQAQGMTANTALDPNSLTNQSQRQLGDTISGKYLDPKTNPYLEGSVNDALGLAKSQFLGLYGGDAGQNIGNSGFQEQLARTLANSALPAYQNAYSQERQNQLNAMNLAPQFDYANANALAGVGAQDEARALQQYNSPWQTLGQYQGAIAGNYGGVTDYQQPYQSQLWNTTNNMAFGPFGQGNGPQMYGSTMGAAGNFFSDVRLKENIERIGTHDTGIGIYKYNYKGSDAPQIGVLAQEVEQVMPEAVGESAGFKTVNYKMI